MPGPWQPGLLVQAGKAKGLKGASSAPLPRNPEANLGIIAVNEFAWVPAEFGVEKRGINLPADANSRQPAGMGAVVGKTSGAVIWSEGQGKEGYGMVELGKPELGTSQDGR